jgi:hypothetical protein
MLQKEIYHTFRRAGRIADCPLDASAKVHSDGTRSDSGSNNPPDSKTAPPLDDSAIAPACLWIREVISHYKQAVNLVTIHAARVRRINRVVQDERNTMAARPKTSGVNTSGANKKTAGRGRFEAEPEKAKAPPSGRTSKARSLALNTSDAVLCLLRTDPARPMTPEEVAVSLGLNDRNVKRELIFLLGENLVDVKSIEAGTGYIARVTQAARDAGAPSASRATERRRGGLESMTVVALAGDQQRVYDRLRTDGPLTPGEIAAREGMSIGRVAVALDVLLRMSPALVAPSATRPGAYQAL